MIAALLHRPPNFFTCSFGRSRGLLTLIIWPFRRKFILGPSLGLLFFFFDSLKPISLAGDHTTRDGKLAFLYKFPPTVFNVKAHR